MPRKKIEDAMQPELQQENGLEMNTLFEESEGQTALPVSGAPDAPPHPPESGTETRDREEVSPVGLPDITEVSPGETDLSNFPGDPLEESGVEPDAAPGLPTETRWPTDDDDDDAFGELSSPFDVERRLEEELAALQAVAEVDSPDSDPRDISEASPGDAPEDAAVVQTVLPYNEAKQNGEQD